MKPKLYRVDNYLEYHKAGPSDLIRLLPAPGNNAICLPKAQIETLVYAIATGQFTHISGATGTAKSSLIEALYQVPENFRVVCDSLGLPVLPLKAYPNEMAVYEAPGELYQRRSLKDGSTFDEMSGLVKSLMDASNSSDKYYHLIWLREIGRVHSASVQGGLLDLMTSGDITLPDGNRINAGKIAWVADSNYQAASDSVHTLVTLDDALKRRFTVNLTLDYLSAEQEFQVLRELIGPVETEEVADEIVMQAVQLGQIVRSGKHEGNLQSVVSPTISGYLAFYNMVSALPHLSRQQVAMSTMLGNASSDDQKQVAGVLNQVFGYQRDDSEDFIEAGGLF